MNFWVRVLCKSIIVYVLKGLLRAMKLRKKEVLFIGRHLKAVDLTMMESFVGTCRRRLDK